jgi:hypothetical protein
MRKFFLPLVNERNQILYTALNCELGQLGWRFACGVNAIFCQITWNNLVYFCTTCENIRTRRKFLTNLYKKGELISIFS